MRILHAKDEHLNNGGRRVFLAVPAYGNVPAEFLFSIWNARDALMSAGVETELMILSGGCHVDDARNLLATKFLESDCTDLVFIDDDTRFQAEDLITLINYNVDVVAGVCPKKILPLDFAYRPFSCKVHGFGELVPVDGVGTAFMKISRKAMQKVANKGRRYKTKIQGVEAWIYQIFERYTDSKTGERWGGDFNFCQKVRRVGRFHVFIDPEMTFGHVGPEEWTGNLAHHLRAINGETDQYIADILTRLKTAPATVKDINNLSAAWNNGLWPASTELLTTLDILAKDGAGDILEFGSGLSTLILATSGRKVETVEHDQKWANRVLDIANMAGLDITVIDAPIIDMWYPLKIKASESTLIFIDGPPRQISDRSKVADGLLLVHPDCTFVIDDTHTESEVVKAISDKFNIKFNDFKTYSIGQRKP